MVGIQFQKTVRIVYFCKVVPMCHSQALTRAPLVNYCLTSGEIVIKEIEGARGKIITEARVDL